MWRWTLCLTLILGCSSRQNSAFESTQMNFANLEWHTVSDRVMGGNSTAVWNSIAKGNRRFEGVVSLANNGGFASVRTTIPHHALKNKNHLLLKVRGDGKIYQVVLKSALTNTSINYHASFQTDGTWQTLLLPLNTFTPKRRGYDIPQLSPIIGVNVVSVGLLIADKQSGPFRLDVNTMEGARPIQMVRSSDTPSAYNASTDE